MEAKATQLADTRPRLDTPLRVAIPVNVPERNINISNDEFIYNNAFSPMALALSKKHQIDLNKKYNSVDTFDFNWKVDKLPKKIHSTLDQDSVKTNLIKDYNVLAFSSRRAGKKDVEASAYASLGIIHDNQSHYSESIDSFLSYLQICEELNDAIGCACACNCIGVDYMMLANPSSDAGALHGITLTSEVTDYLEKAITFHRKHLDIGPDAGGRFVANTNLALCLGMLGDINQSAKYHQDALRIAIKMQTLYGQSIAVGNLGLLAIIKQDYTTSKTCFDQHLQLVQALLDPEAEITAWKLLAKLSTAQGHHEAALDSLEQARRIAEKEGFLNELRRIHCLIGVSRGTLELDNYVSHLLNEQQPQMY